MPTSTWWTLELFYTRRKTTQLNKLNQIEFSFQDAFCEKDFFLLLLKTAPAKLVCEFIVISM